MYDQGRKWRSLNNRRLLQTYALITNGVNSSHFCQMTGWLVYNAAQRIWREVVMAKFEILHCHFPGVRKTMKTLAWIFFRMTFMAFTVFLHFLTSLFNNTINLRLYNVNDGMINKCGAAGEMRFRMKSRSSWRKSTRVTSSTTNLRWPDLGWNPNHHGGNTATTITSMKSSNNLKEGSWSSSIKLYVINSNDVQILFG